MVRALIMVIVGKALEMLYDVLFGAHRFPLGV